MSLFATKPIESDPAQPLRRVLGALDLTLLGIGAIIGTGIFVLFRPALMPLVLLNDRHLQGPFTIEIERPDVQRHR